MPKRTPKDWKPGTERKLKEFLGRLSDQDMLTVMETAGQLNATDSPSGSDIANIFAVYAEGSEDVREGIDAAFRWWTGYNFDSVVAQALHGPDWESVVRKWRPGP